MKNTRSKQILFVGALIVLMAWVATEGKLVSAAFEGEARLVGAVVDTSGAPVADAAILVTRGDAPNYKMQKTTGSDGRFSMLFLDATKAYKIRIEKPGYRAIEKDLALKPNETSRETYTLSPN